jgi:anhydro-N-acetylmuramic acid kinase
LSGGGTRNPVLMNNLQLLLKKKVVSRDEYGIPSDAKEAISFAVLGNEFLHGNTNNLPSVTGANHTVVMGKLVMPGGARNCDEGSGFNFSHHTVFGTFKYN